MVEAKLVADPKVCLPPGASQVERLASLDIPSRDEMIGSFVKDDHRLLERGEWEHLARAPQKPPEGEWRTWLILAGRGFGKTRAGAEWVRARAEAGAVRIALVAATLAEARAVMVEGETGLLAIAPRENRPLFEPANRRLIWPSGAQAFLYSAGEPDSLRGPQHHFAWCDEIGKWARGMDTWDNLAMGLRLGSAPRTVVTTTPRAVPLVRRLVSEASADGPVRKSTGRMIDNSANLAPAFVETMTATYQGTRTARQELGGELIEDVEGALWSRALIEQCRVARAPSARRVVIGVDPPAGAGASSDACGIVAVALGEDGIAYVIGDVSIRGAAPEAWAARVSEASATFAADRIIAEANNGGAMVESVLRAADCALPVRLVHAAHGKVARAEPVAALYALGRARHVGAFPELEDEMAGLMIGGDYAGPGRSPDRADALVWAMSELMLGRKGLSGPAVRVI